MGLGAFASAVLACAACAAPVAAAPQWHAGTIEKSYVGNCLFEPETGIVANAEFQADPQALPRPGEVFYVRTIPGRVGNGCGIGMSVHVEIVPPPGVTPAVSASTPVRCQYMDIQSGALTAAEGCPRQAYVGVYGPAFDQVAPGGPDETRPWDLPYGKALVIEIPLRSAGGLAGTSPSCPRSEGAPPCGASEANGALQFANKVIDGWASPWLSPYVPLFVEAAGAVRVARSIALARLLQGLPVAIHVARGGSRVVARLSAGRRLLAAKTVSKARAGTLRLRLKPSRAAARRLRRGRRPFTATLRIRVSPPGGPGSTTSLRIRVRPR